MKDLLKLYFLFFVIFIEAQDFETAAVSEFSDEQVAIANETKAVEPYTFEKAAKRYALQHKTFTTIKSQKDGYYVIAGIFENDKHLKAQVRKLNAKGFDAGYFQNPETQLNYLYLNRYPTWQEAFANCETNFENRYNEDVWVLRIDNGVSDNETIALENVTYEILQEIEPILPQESKGTMAKPVNDPDSKSRLIQMADENFDKMWYAEAARLYELALEKDGQDFPFDVLRKAGDAHYFNTDMEQAHKWYSLLYDKYESQMSSDNIFKYAHTLKGTGNYGRSKRLMKVYSKKLEGEKVGTNHERNEIVLDGLLRMKDRFQLKNLDINSEFSEFSPAYFNTDEIVYASSKDSSVFNTRRYKWNNQPYLDLYVAKVNEGSQELKDAIKFSKKINSKYHEASVAFSPDNKTMYFTRNNYGKKLKRDKNGINNLKIYRSTKIDGDWTEAEEVPFNSDEYSTGHPALSKDGKQLYFVSDMPGSIGETDIFVVDVLENGSFSQPRNLGPEINTKQKEMFPFINDRKLYFSSNGHVGLGGLDVFEVAFNDEDGYLEVRNVGKPINSKKDDFSYIVNEETQEGYFASNRAGGKGDDDIYSFKKLQLEEVPVNKNAIAGIITEMVSGELMPNALVELLDGNNIKIKETVADQEGTFIFEDLEGDTRYVLRTTKDAYYENHKAVETVDNEMVNVEVSMKKLNEMIKIENGIRKLKTEMIHFNFDRYAIRTDAAQELDKLVAVMKESPDMVIKIESHTDSRGPAVYNKYLSDRRAKSTRDYIVAQGIDPQRIESAIGYGEERLLNECDGTTRCTEKQHYLNRRSEFIIVAM